MKQQPGERDNGRLREVAPIMTDIAGNPAALFDFGRLQEMPEGDLGAVRALHETFLRNLCSSLTIPLRSFLVGEVLSVEQMSFGAFSDALPVPTTLAFLQAPACETPCVLEISMDVVSPILDLLMGGTGKAATDQRRELTEMEKDLLERPLGIVVRDLTRAWSVCLRGEFALNSIRTNPRSAGSVSRSESMVVICMRLSVGEAGGSLKLAVPASLTKLVVRDIDPLLRVPRAHDSELEGAIRERLESELLVDVDFELRGSSMRLKDLLELKPATVVDLGVVCDGAITVAVNGRPKFTGWLTQAGPRMVVTVE